MRVNSQRSFIGLVILLVLIVLAFLIGQLSYSSKSKPVSRSQAAYDSSLYGFGVQDNNSGTGRSVPEFEIIHTRYPWGALMPSPRQVNLSPLRYWVNENTNAGKKSQIGILLNVVPSFMLSDPQFEAVQGQYLNYANPKVQEQYRIFIQALCNEFCANPNVILEVNAGWDGEPDPAGTKEARDAYKAAWANWTPTSSEVTLPTGAKSAWMNWLYFVTKTWADIVNNQRPTYIVTTQVFTDTGEHTTPFIKYNSQVLSWISYIEARGLGVKTTGFTFDTGKYWSASYSWQKVMRDFAKKGKPVSCEKGATDINTLPPEIFYLVHDEHFYWAVWSALDMGCNQLLVVHKKGDPYEWKANEIFGTDSETKASSVNLFNSMQQFSDKPVASTNTAWIVLRTTELVFAPYCIENPANCDTQNFSFGITQKEPAGGRTIPEWNNYWSIGAGGGNPPYSPNSRIASLDTQKTKEGRYTRRTDIASGNSKMFFDVDDSFLSGGTPVNLKIKYFDYGPGKKWSLWYKGSDGNLKKAGDVTKGDTRSWKEVSFSINNASWNNSLDGGSDFYIDAEGDDDEFIHWIFVERGTPTTTPTPPTGPNYDLNNDGFVNASDLAPFKTYFRSGNLLADFNRDGVVNVIDFEFLRRRIVRG